MAEGKKRPLQKTKAALQQLLSKQDDADEDVDVEDDEHDDDDDKVEGGGDGDGDGDEAKAQATPGNLDKEGRIADARQPEVVSKEKAKPSKLHKRRLRTRLQLMQSSCRRRLTRRKTRRSMVGPGPLASGGEKPMIEFVFEKTCFLWSLSFFLLLFLFS